ncbi:fucolectin-like [Siphateles boraxobius]|uniref:fucolectin-like n=1 Tax=Siphateles boraxobius TaxID=180520 RepID=UPI004063B5E9
MMGIIVCWLTLLGLVCVQEYAGGAQENLAPRGTAIQSSTYRSADLAIDGVKDFSTDSSSCAFTLSENDPWWRLDLQASYQVNIVVVTYRETYFINNDRWRNVEIHFGNSLQNNGNDNPRCAMISVDPATCSVTYSCGDLDGRYINALLPGLNVLRVCEMEVYESEKKRQIVRLEVKSGQDLNDPEVKKEILAKIEQILKEKGVSGGAQLSWRTQSDGNVFQKKERKSCQTCL